MPSEFSPALAPEQDAALDATWRRAFTTVGELVGGRVTAAVSQQRWRPAWFLDVTRSDGEVKRVYFRGDRGESGPGVYPLEHELGVLRALADAGLPVPHVYGFCAAPRGIVMERVPGRANLATADAAEARAVLEHYMELLARLHALPLRTFDALPLARPANAREIALGDLPRWERSFRAHKREPAPLIEFALGWLARNIPAHRTRAVMLAGDSGQFLFEHGRVTALIDLELAYIGDPLADLAGLLCRNLSEPLGDLSHGVRHYAQTTGEAVDLDVLHYHAVRFGMVTPLAVAPLCDSAPPGFNVAQYLGWNLVYGRIPLELIARNIGAQLEAPEIPAPAPTRWSRFHDSLVRGLAASNNSYESDVAFRCAQLLREADRAGARLEAQDLEEASALLGRRVGDWREADAALEAAVLTATPARDAEFVRFFLPSHAASTSAARARHART